MTNLSKEKLDWMKEVGIIEFKKPMRYADSKSNMVYSEEYIENTSPEELKRRYDKHNIFRDKPSLKFIE